MAKFTELNGDSYVFKPGLDHCESRPGLLVFPDRTTRVGIPQISDWKRGKVMIGFNL